jgi:alkylated DNA repair dioxygenase AlkB
VEEGLRGARGSGAAGAATERRDAAAPDLSRLPDARLSYDPRFLPAGEAEALFAELLAGVPWRAERIRLFGREVAVPRLQAWVGDPGAVYTYSGLTLVPLPWPPAVAAIRARLVALRPDLPLNSALLNLYRDGRDSMGWHSDDEPELGAEPAIASVSLGATRRFRLRHKTRGELRVEIDLASGSLLWMEGRTQECWQHALPRRTGRNDPGARINLTFRTILGVATR